jgi:hypothetical protein
MRLSCGYSRYPIVASGGELSKHNKQRVMCSSCGSSRYPIAADDGVLGTPLAEEPFWLVRFDMFLVFNPFARWVFFS